jgi:hypothetical protein
MIVSSLLFAITTVKTQTKSQKMKNIDLAGLIVDSETKKPIEGVKIYGENEEDLAVTNSEGYFKIKLSCEKKEEIRFQLKIKKEGYVSFVQREHWGGADNLGTVYYIGLSQRHSNHDSFSEMLTNLSDISYAVVNQKFESVKAEIALEEKIENEKKGNDKVFFEIDNGFYIVNKSGWIKLKTKEDRISINGEKVVSALQINSLVKRKSVKGMTPIVSDISSVMIKTQ